MLRDPQATNGHLLELRSPYSGEVIGRLETATESKISEGIASARKGYARNRRMPRHQRAAILAGAADRVAARQEELARIIVVEAGKTIRQARKEVARCVNTLRLSAEEAKQLRGEVVPFDSFAGSERRRGYFVIEPLGVILAITPFNDPLNLVAHKVGPAIAGGNAVILKPSELAPLSALALAKDLYEAGLDPSILTVMNGGSDVAQALVRSPEVRMISFTGGPRTGELITRAAGLKKIAMDLGGNAPVIVMADCNLEQAAESCASGAFWAAGQNCIGVQRILVMEAIQEEFTNRLVEITRALKVGDPMEEDTDVGPMISAANAQRIESWVEEAVQSGARVLTGHRREGAVYHPTILSGVPSCAKVLTEEVFAPVVSIQTVNSLEAAIDEANRSDFSLHAAIFTRDLESAFLAADRLDAGGVMVNDSSDYRFDGMPFGGYKIGSLGREGVRFAIHEMTQQKVVCFNF
jgi:glyceraldehyde-3-phosphate dehydrogenase (NADP+)